MGAYPEHMEPASALRETDGEAPSPRRVGLRAHPKWREWVWRPGPCIGVAWITKCVQRHIVCSIQHSGVLSPVYRCRPSAHPRQLRTKSYHSRCYKRSVVLTPTAFRYNSSDAVGRGSRPCYSSHLFSPWGFPVSTRKTSPPPPAHSPRSAPRRGGCAHDGRRAGRSPVRRRE